MSLSRHFTSERDLSSFAALIGEHLKPGDTLFFEGVLGVGKSAFIRSLLRHICQDPTLEVPSPTFTLVQTYDTPQGEVWHVDLYRLERKDDIEELGIYDAMGEKIVLMEWPDRLKPRSLPQDYLLLHFDYGENPDERHLTLLPQGCWEERIKQIAKGK